MKHAHKIKMRWAILALLGIICLIAVPAIAEDCDGVSCRDMGSDPSPGGSTNNYPGGHEDDYSAPEHDASAEWEERHARVQAAQAAAIAAYARADYHEALRLLYEQQKLLDNPNVRQMIATTKETIAKVEARAQKEREQAAREEQARANAAENRIAKEKQDIETAAKIRDKIDTFAASLDSAPPKAGVVVPETGIAVDNGMGTHKAYAPLKFGSSEDLEALSEQARQGFDKKGPFMGSVPVPPSSDDPASHDPQMIDAERELAQLVNESARIDENIEELTRQRNVEKDTVKIQALTLDLSQQQKVKEQKLVEIFQKEEKNKKLHRTINTRVEGEREKTK